MGEIEKKTFEVTVAGRDLSLFIGNCAIALFRTQQEVDYIAVDIEEDGEEQTLRVFNNPELARWMAGYSITYNKHGLLRLPVNDLEHHTDHSFRELMGWNPAVIEREQPNDKELEMWTEVNTTDLEDGLTELLG